MSSSSSNEVSSGLCLPRAKEFVELHEQIQASTNLLDSLESFLSTFQKDLSSVSGEISELQDRSSDIESRLKSRKSIEKPLASLLSDLTIPPTLATTLLDTEVSESWIQAVEDFERRLEICKARSRVKAARDLTDVVEGLRIVTATKLRAFFLALFQPIRKSVTTNMQVLQTSVLVKFSPLFAFLQRQAPNVAHEIQRSYVGAARTYYETGFRRYIRSLTWIKARSIDKVDSFASPDASFASTIDNERLRNASIDGPSVTLAYMGDVKTHKEPIEATVRSLLLVLMDNATAEYAFVSTFFAPASPLLTPASEGTLSPSGSMLSPKSGTFELPTPRGERGRTASFAGASMAAVMAQAAEETSQVNAIWKQVVDPILEYSQTFIKSAIDPSPPVIPLLTIIRLTENVVGEVQRRNCPPLESYIFTLRMQMWPIFQKCMSTHTDELKTLSDGSGGGFFSRAVPTTNPLVELICTRYAVFFNSFVALTEESEETMIFSNLLRLRQEVVKLIQKHTDKITDPTTRATTKSTMYERLLQGLSKGTLLSAHAKSQEEVAYWANLEEEARRKISSARQVNYRQRP